MRPAPVAMEDAGARSWWPFALAAIVWAIVAAQNIALPGVYQDAVNPDYFAVRLLHLHTQPIGAELLPGNYVLNRLPVLIAFYHGALPTYLGLPGFLLFGTTVLGLRITHALFALAVLASLYALLGRGGARPWLAALACAALALDPGFSYAFRTQSYITLMPAALLFLSLVAMQRARTAAMPLRWLAGSGALYGLAVVGYFIYAFFLPALVLALLAWAPEAVRLRARAGAWIAGVAAGASLYPLGYALLVVELGGIAPAWAYFQQVQRELAAFSEQPDLATRVVHAATMVDAVVRNWFHHQLIFGEHAEVPGGGLKLALLFGAPLVLWMRAEWRRDCPVLLRVLAALVASHLAFALLFGTRLAGHHFMVLLPLAYGALAMGIAANARTAVARRRAAVGALLPFLTLAALNVGGQLREAARLEETGGAGLFSDAINRLAADLLARERRPFLYVADWGLTMPVAFLTGGRIGVDPVANHDAARLRLCSGTDVAVAVVEGDRAARIAGWQRAIGWDAPSHTRYAQRDGKEVFVVATFRGRRDAPACSATSTPVSGGAVAPGTQPAPQAPR